MRSPSLSRLIYCTGGWSLLIVVFVDGSLFGQEGFRSLPPIHQEQAAANDPFRHLPPTESYPSIHRPAPRPVTSASSSSDSLVVSATAWTSSNKNVAPNSTLSSTVDPVIPATASVPMEEGRIPLRPANESSNAKKLNKPSSPWSSLLSMVFSLVVVIGLFFVVARCFRSGSQSLTRTLPKEVVQVLGRAPFAARQQLYLLRFGRKLVLVSQQMGQTQTLSEIDEPSEVDHLLGLCEQNSPTSISNSFREVLQGFTGLSNIDSGSRFGGKLSRKIAVHSQLDSIG